MSRCTKCDGSWAHDAGLHDRVPQVGHLSFEELSRLAAAEAPEYKVRDATPEELREFIADNPGADGYALEVYEEEPVE